MRRMLGVLALLLVLPACGQAGTTEGPPPDGTDELEALIAAAPIAEVEGGAVSPDGRFEIRAEGASGQYVSGIQPPEFLQIVDRETGEVLWQDQGWTAQSILWSPRGGFAALAVTARTGCSIRIIETKGWTSWDFTLPDGSPIPEHTFLPDDEPWGVWTGEGDLDLTIGRGGDAGEQSFYTCAVLMRDGGLKVIVWEELHEIVPGDHDFDHDGEPEIVELAAVYDGEQDQTGWHEVRIRTADDSLYWSRSLHESHPGWGSYFACRMDGEDYLLRYTPTMNQGSAAYAYQLFSLDKDGEEQVVREGAVDFDLNFGSPMHEGYDPEAIANFLEEVHGLLEDSELLLTTESGEFRSGGPGADFRDDLGHWTSEDLYDDSRSLEENIRTIGEYWKDMRESG